MQRTPPSTPRSLAPSIADKQHAQEVDTQRAAWTQGLGEIVRTPEASRSDDLNRLVLDGVVPDDRLRIKYLVQECVQCGEEALLGVLLDHVPMEGIDLWQEPPDGDAMTMLHRALPANVAMKALELSELQLPDTAIRQLGLVLNKAGISELSLSRMSLNAGAFALLADVVVSAPGLKSLNLGYIKPQDARTERSALGAMLCNVLEKKAELAQLCVESAPSLRLGDHARIAKLALQAENGLSVLALIDCNVKGLGAQALSTSLRGNTTLQVLSLDSNPIGSEGYGYVAEALAENKTLHTLELGTCGLEDGRVDLAQLVARSNIRVLELAGNPIGDESLVPMIDAVKSNPRLQSLDLRKTRAANECMSALAELLSGHSSLIKLRLPALNDAALSALVEAVRRNPTILKLDFASTSRQGPGKAEIKRYLERNARAPRQTAFAQGAMAALFADRGAGDGEFLSHYTLAMEDELDRPSLANLGLVNRETLHHALEARAAWEARMIRAKEKKDGF